MVIKRDSDGVNFNFASAEALNLWAETCMMRQSVDHGYWIEQHNSTWRKGDYTRKHDEMFKSLVKAIVAVSDAVGGPQGDRLMRDHIFDLYQAAQQALNYLDRLDGGLCSKLLHDLAAVDGLDLDNLPTE